MRLGALAFQRDVQFQARQLRAEIGEMARDSAPRAATRMPISSTSTRRRRRRDSAHGPAARLRAQHDFDADIARSRRARTLFQKVSDAPSSSTSSARTWPVPVKASGSGASTACPPARATPRRPRKASEAALIALPACVPRCARTQSGGFGCDRSNSSTPAGSSPTSQFAPRPRRRRLRPARRARSEYFHSSTRRVGMPRARNSACRLCATFGQIGRQRRSCRVLHDLLIALGFQLQRQFLAAFLRRCGRPASTWMRSGTM